MIIISFVERESLYIYVYILIAGNINLMRCYIEATEEIFINDVLDEKGIKQEET